MLQFLLLKNYGIARNDKTWRFNIRLYGIICGPSIAGLCIEYTAARNYANILASTARRVEKDFYIDKRNAFRRYPRFSILHNNLEYNGFLGRFRK